MILSATLGSSVSQFLDILASPVAWLCARLGVCWGVPTEDWVAFRSRTVFDRLCACQLCTRDECICGLFPSAST